jgi:pimeloyl-ACP methyl ester carboxylesterase
MQLAHELTGRSHDPSLVLIHGITENHHVWHPLLHSLANGRQVLAVDLRGHGDSDHSDPYDPISYATDVVETVNALGMRDPIVVGHSLGGVVASAYAAIAPCAGVINVDQPLRLGDFQQGLKEMESMLTGSHEEFETAIDMIFTSMMGPLVPSEMLRVRGLRGAADQKVVLGTWDAVLHQTAEELDATVVALAGAVTVPYLSIHGIDPGPGYAQWLTALIPTATVELWSDLGHYPMLMEPDRFVQRLVEFEAQVRG